LFLLKTWEDADPINIGSGQEVSIIELAGLIAEVVGWAGRFEFDAAKPDGTPRKLLDTTRLTAMGWTASIGLTAGLANAYADLRVRWNAGEFAAEAVQLI
jgi:GDP-L-fucose synthase